MGVRKKGDKGNGILSWARKNKKVLWWPLGGIIFLLVLSSFMLTIIDHLKNKPFVEEEVINQLKYKPEVPVTIQLRSNIEKDTNILNVTNRRERLDIMKEYSGRIIDTVTADLDEGNFKFKGRGLFFPSFDGNITRSGLQKLKDDTRVESIHLAKKTHTTSSTTYFAR